MLVNYEYYLGQGCPTFWLTWTTFEGKNCPGPQVKYTNSTDFVDQNRKLIILKKKKKKKIIDS